MTLPTATTATGRWNPGDARAHDEAEPERSDSPAALSLGTIAGIRIRVHATFFLLLAWIAATHFLRGERVAQVASAIAFVITVFGVVVLHELGHALTARLFGIRTRDITLLPIGGVARLDRMPERPAQEIAVALAGPAVNVVLALLVLVALVATNAQVGPLAVAASGGSFLAQLFWVNVGLAVFNLVPAFPLDGGRVFRAALATGLDYERATAIAAKVGRVIAVALGFIGLTGNPMLVLVAVFIWVGGGNEAAFVHVRSALAGLRVGQAMIVDFRALAPGDPIARAVELTLASFQADFPVVRDDEIVGLLTREDVLRALGERGADAPVESVMRHLFPVTDVSEPLERALPLLRASGDRVLPVLREGRLAGLLTLENVGELVVVRAAQRAHPSKYAARGAGAP